MSRDRYAFCQPLIFSEDVERENASDKSGAWIVRNIPRGLMKRATITDMVEGQPIRLS